MRKFLLSLSIFLGTIAVAHSIEKVQAQESLPGLTDEYGQIWRPAPTPPGGLDWNTIANIEFKPKDVGDFYLGEPIHSEEVLALDGQTVKINGYMIPLEASEMQSRFVLMAYPHSCPFDMPVGAGGYVEIQADFPVEYTYDPVLVEGTFQVLEDYSRGLYYKISAARELKD